jgi:AraC-like DNA-binding protein/mannose-6-phosphate isomerase-like protein (cupin superfamily)
MTEPTAVRRPIPVALPPDGVFVFESHHRPGFRMAGEAHDFLELFYVLEGSGSFLIAGRTCPCRRGDLVAVPPGMTHRIVDEPARPLAVYGIAVAPHVWRGEPDLCDRLPADRLPVGGLLAAKVRADLKRLLFEQTHARPGSRTLVLGLTLQLLALLARTVVVAESARRSGAAPTPCRQAVERYAAELPHRFLEATDLDAAAAELGMSRRRFTQLFREITGTTWAANLTRLRIDHACRLLRETSHSILATAFACGYDDLSLFYRVFRRQTGTTPRAWRERA